MTKLMRRVLIALILVSSACSSSDLSMKSLGNSILDTVGLGPVRSAFDAASSLAKATETLSREEEYYLGRAVAARILSTYPLENDQELTRYVSKVGLSLSAASDKPETFGGYHFAVLQSDQINAMAAPGGFVFITKGMLQALPNEEALAAALAHEIGHISLQHGVKSISQANLNQALLSLGNLAGSLNCAQVVQQASEVFGAAVDDVIATLLEKGYSRDQEFEADEVSALLLKRTGYSGDALPELLQTVKNSTSSNGSSWLKAHPGLDSRIQRAAKLVGSIDSGQSELGKLARSTRFDGFIHQLK